jgi:hypothetical protein
MKYIVKQMYDPSIDRIYYGVFTDQELGFIHHESEDQNLLLLLDEEEHANIICAILNEEDNK